jgi:hypothetical protein
VATGDKIDAGDQLGEAGAGGRLGRYVVRFEVAEGSKVIAPGVALAEGRSSSSASATPDAAVLARRLFSAR